jgi:Tfp pilus assembly protein FimV
MWILVALLQATPMPCVPAATELPPPPLVVQVVDATWLPVAGAEVIVRTHQDRRVRQTAAAGRDGFAHVTVPRDAEYDIEARLRGFRTEHVRGVRLSTSSLVPTAYVQVRLKQLSTGEPVS